MLRAPVSGIEFAILPSRPGIATTFRQIFGAASGAADPAELEIAYCELVYAQFARLGTAKREVSDHQPPYRDGGECEKSHCKRARSERADRKRSGGPQPRLRRRPNRTLVGM